VKSNAMCIRGCSPTPGWWTTPTGHHGQDGNFTIKTCRRRLHHRGGASQRRPRGAKCTLGADDKKTARIHPRSAGAEIDPQVDRDTPRRTPPRRSCLSARRALANRDAGHSRTLRRSSSSCMITRATCAGIPVGVVQPAARLRIDHAQRAQAWPSSVMSGAPRRTGCTARRSRAGWGKARSFSASGTTSHPIAGCMGAERNRARVSVVAQALAGLKPLAVLVHQGRMSAMGSGRWWRPGRTDRQRSPRPACPARRSATGLPGAVSRWRDRNAHVVLGVFLLHAGSGRRSGLGLEEAGSRRARQLLWSGRRFHRPTRSSGRSPRAPWLRASSGGG